MLPLIFILPLMNACMPLSLPVDIATKSASLIVIVQSAFGGADGLTQLPPLASTVHVAPLPPGPFVMLNWKTPLT